jgi:hypothetical protein
MSVPSMVRSLVLPVEVLPAENVLPEGPALVCVDDIVSDCCPSSAGTLTKSVSE